jgi:hypothetical protein
MGILAQGNAVLRMVVAAVGELMDMGGVNDTASIHRDTTIPGQSARVVVGWNDREAEPSLPSPFPRFGVESGVRANDIVGWGRQADQIAKSGTFGGVREVVGDQDAAELLAEYRVLEACVKVRVKLYGDGASPFRSRLTFLIERCPATVTVEMEEWQVNGGTLRAPVGNDSPKGEETEGEFATQRQQRHSEFAFLSKASNDEKQQRFVGRDILLAVNPQIGRHLQPTFLLGW